jgi:cysteine-rich repeat protein
MNEECDDGNTEDGDGCSSDCRQEPRCGDGSVDESIGEVCDDGNTVDGDGCNRFCQSDETCGNGYVDRPVGEECEFEFQCIVINPRYTCFGCICLPPLG